MIPQPLAGHSRDHETAFGLSADPADRTDIVQAFVAPSALQPADPAALERIAARARALPEDTTRVLSHERLAGYPAAGGIDQEIIARRIQASYPQAKILMITREQRDMIKSMYLQYLSDGGALSLSRYLSGVDRNLFRKPQFEPAYYDYAAALAMYRRHFGAQNVLCLPYEMLRRDPQGFIGELGRFAQLPPVPEGLAARLAGTRVNTQRSDLELVLRRIANGMVRTQLSDYGITLIGNAHLTEGFKKISPLLRRIAPPRKSRQTRIAARIDTATQGRYGASNRALADMTGIDFAAFGYEMASAPHRTPEDPKDAR